jgi:transposase InsO family protein
LRGLHATIERSWLADQHEPQSKSLRQRKSGELYETLKHEEVNRVEYRDMAEARRGIRQFLERTYNRKRLHSALGYRPPSEFDALPQSSKVPA